MGYIAFALFVLGVSLIIVYFSVMKKHNSCSAQTRGKLTKIGQNRSRDVSRSEYYYSYNVDGIDYQLKTFDASPDAKKVGDYCTIWYNPKKPKSSLAHRYSSYKVFKILLFGGIAMIVLSVIIPFISLAMSTW